MGLWPMDNTFILKMVYLKVGKINLVFTFLKRVKYSEVLPQFNRKELKHIQMN